MRLVSLNLCGYSDWEGREPRVVSFLNEVNADIVCFQEVKFDIARSAYSQASYLNHSLLKPYEYSAASVTKFYRPSSGEPYREGLAVLSRYPIANTESLVLHQATDDKHVRIIQNVDINNQGETVKISNVHFSNNVYSTEQLKETLSLFKARQEERIIVGDFNIFRLDELQSEYQDKYANSFDFSKYVSFPSEGYTFDYMLLPLVYMFSSVEATEGLSDHNALVIDFS